MEHPTPPQLAQLALGERDVRVAAHVADCARCTAELERLAEVEQALAEPDEAPMPAAPAPEQLWEGVAAELGLGEATSGEESGASDAAPPDEAEAPSPVTSLEQAPSRRNRVLALASAAALVIVVGVAAAAVVLLPEDPEPEPVVAAEATLEPLDDQPAPARASLVHVQDPADEPDAEAPEPDAVAPGERRLRLDIAELPEHDGYFELWLLDDEDEPTALLSLGPLTSETELPPDLDLDAYPVVDISREAYDGDPAHSGDSVLRGRLADAG